VTDQQAPRRFRGFEKLRAHWPDVLIVLGLLGLFWCRHRFFEEVEVGGDAVEKWQFVRQWHYANDFSQGEWTHHMARMGVNVTTWFVQKLFGTSWRSYYIGPFVTAALQVPFIYLVAKRLGGRFGALLAVLLILFMAMVHRSASQLLPDGYQGTWAIIACYLYVRFLEAEGRTRQRYLLALGVASFIGYLAKETFVFFYPGFVLAVWLARRSWRDVAWFCGILLAGLVLETAAYTIFTDYHSRWAIVRGTHLIEVDEAEVEAAGMRFADLFKRFDELHNATKYLLFFSLGAALWQAVLREEPKPLARGVALVGISYIFFVTFAIRSISPLDVLQGFDPRYMEPATPLMGVWAGSFLAVVAGRLWSTPSSRSRLLERFGPGGEPWAQAAWSLLVIGLLTVVTLRDQRKDPPLNAFVRGEELSGLLNRTYDRNLPISERSAGRAKLLTAVYDVYMDDRKLARNGKLPDLRDARLVQRGTSYLIKDHSVYRKETLARLLDEGCHVALKKGGSRNKGTRDRRSTIVVSAEPPPRCDALLAELTAR
jgi:hypothetical protein